MAGEALQSLRSPLDWLHMTGGEPLLTRSEFFEVLRAVHPYHHGNMGVATNGFWATSEEQALATVLEMKSLGVDGISLSVDRFHQQAVPLDRIKHAASAIAEAGMADHCWIVTSLLCDGAAGADGLNASSLEMAREISEISGIPVAETEVRSIGRGSEASALDGDEMPRGPCRDLACCLGETGPFDPRMIWIDPLGNVFICYGITIGSLEKKPLQVILDEYDYKHNPILSVLADSGPKGLFHLCADFGVAPEAPGFRDECDLCFQARKALRPHFPQILAPEQCYP